MRYQKPEVVVLGSALRAVQNTCPDPKKGNFHADSDPDCTKTHSTPGAYEADE